jgi:hypothetical protein
MRSSDLQAMISDVEFISGTVPTTITVKLHDHTGLGGRMGTESTSVIKSWTFSSEKLARSWAKMLIERMAEHDSRINPERDVPLLFKRFDEQSDGAALVDLLSVGVSIECYQSKVITGFNYLIPTVTRVSASAE